MPKVTVRICALSDTCEVQAVKAVLEYYENEVELLTVEPSELLPMTRGRGRIYFEYRGVWYYNVDMFLGDLSTRGLLRM
jgi:hypothetical protein